MKVNTEELIRQAMQLRPVVNQIAEAAELTQQVAVALEQESISDEFRPILDRLHSKLDAQALDMEILKGTLELIAESYSCCETRITDKTEDPGILQGIIPAGWMDFTQEDTPPVLDWVPWDPD